MDSTDAVMKIGTVRTFLLVLFNCVYMPSAMFCMWWWRYHKHFSKCHDSLWGFL